MISEAKKKLEFYNKKARFDYEILDSVEAGIALLGQEIKAIRHGRVSLTGSHARIINGEIFWIGGNIAASLGDDQRTRKLLLNRSQIERLIGKSTQEGLTLIPLKLYLKRGRAKLELGLARGMKKYDKREKIKKRDQEREIGRKTKKS